MDPQILCDPQFLILTTGVFYTKLNQNFTTGGKKRTGKGHEVKRAWSFVDFVMQRAACHCMLIQPIQFHIRPVVELIPAMNSRFLSTFFNIFSVLENKKFKKIAYRSKTKNRIIANIIDKCRLFA